MKNIQKNSLKIRYCNQRKNYLYINFYNTGDTPYFVHDKIIRVLDAGLVLEFERIFLVTNGPKIDYEILKNPLVTVLAHNDIPSDTVCLEFMKNHANETVLEPVNFLYLQNKDFTVSNSLFISEWVDYIFYFLMRQYEQCLVCLEKYDICGVDLILGKNGAYYNGNMWWAKSEYINLLPELSDSFSAEIWAASGPNKWSFWNSNVNHYRVRYPKIIYAGKNRGYSL